MVFETTVFGFRVIELVAGVFATASAAIGLYIGYQALKSFYRHRDPSMRFLAVGLILLTAVTYTFTFIGSVLVQLRVLSLPQQDYFWTTAQLIQFAGLVCIAYALHRRP
jgi:hypothetical protein